jgi:hypothetical protein
MCATSVHLLCVLDDVYMYGIQSGMAKKSDIDDLITKLNDPETKRRLEERGYKLRPEMVKKTFVVPADALATFLDMQKRLKISISGAVTEAMLDWVEKRRKD